MVSVQSAFVGGKNVGLEKAGGQGCSREGEYCRLVEPHLAVVPMKMRKPTLNGVGLGPKFLVSYRPIIARASARVCIYSIRSVQPRPPCLKIFTKGCPLRVQ